MASPTAIPNIAIPLKSLFPAKWLSQPALAASMGGMCTGVALKGEYYREQAWAVQLCREAGKNGRLRAAAMGERSPPNA
jgi:hypothetical protein